MESKRKRLHSILKNLGLTEKEAEVYVAIYVKGSATVKELLESLRNIHQPQLYNILSSLLRKGFIRASMGRPKTYSAISLDALFESRKVLLDNLRSEAKEIIDQLKVVESEIEPEEAFVSLVRGYSGIEANVVEVFASAQTEVCAELPEKVLESSLDVIENTLSRGVNVFLLVFPKVSRRIVERLSKYKNIKLRVHKLGGFLMVTADIKNAIYARRRFYSSRKFSVPDSEVYGFFISEKDLIWRLLSIWETSWRASEEVISWPLAPQSYPKVFLEFGLSVYELEDLFRKGYYPYVSVEGRFVRSREPVKLKGFVVDVKRTTDIWNFTLDTGEEKFTVGGFDAEVEDIEANKVIIEKVQ